MSKLVSVV